MNLLNLIVTEVAAHALTGLAHSLRKDLYVNDLLFL